MDAVPAAMRAVIYHGPKDIRLEEKPVPDWSRVIATQK